MLSPGCRWEVGLKRVLPIIRMARFLAAKNFPRDNPRLAVGYLCDESGSMSDEAIAASVRTRYHLAGFV